MFTRQAWEGQVRQAIDEIAEARREEIDWVLSDDPADIAAELTPDELRQRLTERYFQDYANAWLDFLNRLRWRQVQSLGEVIDQLALMSDVRQFAADRPDEHPGLSGPGWRARAGRSPNSPVKSAQKLVGPGPDTGDRPAAAGPGQSTGRHLRPLLALLGKDARAATTATA